MAAARIPAEKSMAQFKLKPGTQSAVRYLDKPFPDIAAFDAVVRSLVLSNPLGCTSYWKGRRNHPPVTKVREMYTAKFVYRDAEGRRIGAGTETYHTVDGYQYGIAAVLSNMANAAAHCGRAQHIPENDLFSVLLKCHDPGGEFFFLHLARNRVTVASYTDEGIRKRVGAWADSVPALR